MYEITKKIISNKKSLHPADHALKLFRFRRKAYQALDLSTAHVETHVLDNIPFWITTVFDDLTVKLSDAFTMLDETQECQIDSLVQVSENQITGALQTVKAVVQISPPVNVDNPKKNASLEELEQPSNATFDLRLHIENHFENGTVEKIEYSVTQKGELPENPWHILEKLKKHLSFQTALSPITQFRKKSVKKATQHAIFWSTHNGFVFKDPHTHTSYEFDSKQEAVDFIEARFPDYLGMIRQRLFGSTVLNFFMPPKCSVPDRPITVAWRSAPGEWKIKKIASHLPHYCLTDPVTGKTFECETENDIELALQHFYSMRWHVDYEYRYNPIVGTSVKTPVTWELEQHAEIVTPEGGTLFLFGAEQADQLAIYHRRQEEPPHKVKTMIEDRVLYAPKYTSTDVSTAIKLCLFFFVFMSFMEKATATSVTPTRNNAVLSPEIPDSRSSRNDALDRALAHNHAYVGELSEEEAGSLLERGEYLIRKEHGRFFVLSKNRGYANVIWNDPQYENEFRTYFGNLTEKRKTEIWNELMATNMLDANGQISNSLSAYEISLYPFFYLPYKKVKPILLYFALSTNVSIESAELSYSPQGFALFDGPKQKFICESLIHLLDDAALGIPYDPVLRRILNSPPEALQDEEITCHYSNPVLNHRSNVPIGINVNGGYRIGNITYPVNRQKPVVSAETNFYQTTIWEYYDPVAQRWFWAKEYLLHVDQLSDLSISELCDFHSLIKTIAKMPLDFVVGIRKAFYVKNSSGQWLFVLLMDDQERTLKTLPGNLTSLQREKFLRDVAFAFNRLPTISLLPVAEKHRHPNGSYSLSIPGTDYFVEKETPISNRRGSVVSTCRETSSGKKYALKTMPAQSYGKLNGNIIGDYFANERELAIAQMLDPGLFVSAKMAFLTINSNEEFSFNLVMEFMHSTLCRYEFPRKEFSITEVQMIFRDVVVALNTLHQLGLIHPDLALDNIFLGWPDKTGRWKTKIADFGIVALLSNAQEMDTTEATIMVRSPEECLGKNVGTHSDVFRLGQLMHEVIAGKDEYLQDIKHHDFGNVGEYKAICEHIVSFDPFKYIFPRIFNTSPLHRKAKDLIMRITARNFTERLTLEEVLAHPFFTDEQSPMRQDALPSLPPMLSIIDLFLPSNFPTRDDMLEWLANYGAATSADIEVHLGYQRNEQDEIDEHCYLGTPDLEKLLRETNGYVGELSEEDAASHLQRGEYLIRKEGGWFFGDRFFVVSKDRGNAKQIWFSPEYDHSFQTNVGIFTPEEKKRMWQQFVDAEIFDPDGQISNAISLRKIKTAIGVSNSDTPRKILLFLANSTDIKTKSFELVIFSMPDLICHEFSLLDGSNARLARGRLEQLLDDANLGMEYDHCLHDVLASPEAMFDKKVNCFFSSPVLNYHSSVPVGANITDDCFKIGDRFHQVDFQNLIAEGDSGKVWSYHELRTPHWSLVKEKPITPSSNLEHLSLEKLIECESDMDFIEKMPLAFFIGVRDAFLARNRAGGWSFYLFMDDQERLFAQLPKLTFLQREQLVRRAALPFAQLPLLSLLPAAEKYMFPDGNYSLSIAGLRYIPGKNIRVQTNTPTLVREHYEQSTGKSFAIKTFTITPSYAATRKTWRGYWYSLEKEIALARTLDPDYFVSAQNAFVVNEDEGIFSFHIVMELMRGTLCQEHFTKEKQFSMTELQMIFKDLVTILEKLHALGLVDRDLYEDQIFIGWPDKNGRWKTKLGDFSHVMFQQNSIDMNNLQGSIHVYAPEECAGENVGPHSDVYRIGVLLYAEIVGNRQYPHGAEKYIPAESKYFREAMCFRITSFNPDSFTFPSIFDTSPEHQAAKDLIRTVMATDPARRPTAKQVLEHRFFKPHQPETLGTIPQGINEHKEQSFHIA